MIATHMTIGSEINAAPRSAPKNMVLTHEDGKFIFRCGFWDNERPRAAGFRYDGIAKQWFTEDAQVASRLMRFADDLASARMETAVSIQCDIPSDFPISVPESLALLPYQLDGARFLASKRGAILADEPGLGKTVQAIAACNSIRIDGRVLILCPKTLMGNWRTEWDKWSTRPDRASVLFREPRGKVQIINYDRLTAFYAQLRLMPWDVVIADEAHLLKTPESRRRRLAVSIPSSRFWALTGTPVLNRPIELWTLLYRIAPGQWGAYHQFGHTYCGAHRTRFGLSYDGITNVQVLRKKLGEFMLRRRKAQVLTDLPAKRRSIVPVECPKKILRQTQEMVAEAKENFAAAAGTAGEEHARSKYLGAIAVARRIEAEAKIPAAIAYAEQVLEGGVDKIVVFAHHHNILDGLYSGLSDYGCVMLDGRSSDEERQSAVEAFQNDPCCRVFVGGIRAAGVGLTLTASSNVLFVEMDWTPAVMVQAEDRVHRIGQRDAVQVHVLVAGGGVDEILGKALVRKQRLIDAALGDGDKNE